MRRGWAWGGLALVVVAGGCTSSGPPAAAPSFVGGVAGVAGSSAPAWTEPSAYQFVLTRGCDAAKSLGRYQVTVRSGAVTRSTRLDHPDAEPSSSSDVNLGPVTDDGEEIDVPTLGGLLDLVQTAADDGGATTRAFDARDGHPVKVTFNTSDSGAAADTECFAVTGYQVG